MSERKKARLRIVSEMTDPEGAKETIRNARTGTLGEDGDALVFEYDDEQSGERAHILLTALPGEARMERRGMTRAMLRFVPGERTGGAYMTLYGEIPVQIDTQSVCLTRAATGGELELCYDVYAGGDLTAHTHLTVTWRV
ncbi:MAG: DUF1934 domain-containing protein [Candidatus Ventricola sp.]